MRGKYVRASKINILILALTLSTVVVKRILSWKEKHNWSFPSENKYPGLGYVHMYMHVRMCVCVCMYVRMYVHVCV